jgi:alanine-synthesizing transaminase
MGSIDFALKLMDEAEVAVSPGRGFGEAGEGFLRFALVENENRLRQAVRQIGRSLRAGAEAATGASDSSDRSDRSDRSDAPPRC